MKKILGLALGITMISLTPAVGNAAGMIKINCSSFFGKKGTFLFEPTNFSKTNKKQSFNGDSAKIDWQEKFMIADFGGGDIAKFYYKTGDVILKGKVEGNCKFKNLSLLKQKKKPVSVSVQQRLKALEERVDRLESNETMKFHKKTKSMRD